MTTATTMALTELAEKGADVDVLRQMVHVWTRRLLQVLVGDEKRSARMFTACQWARRDTPAALMRSAHPVLSKSAA